MYMQYCDMCQQHYHVSYVLVEQLIPIVSRWHFYSGTLSSIAYLKEVPLCNLFHQVSEGRNLGRYARY